MEIMITQNPQANDNGEIVVIDPRETANSRDLIQHRLQYLLRETSVPVSEVTQQRSTSRPTQ